MSGDIGGLGGVGPANGASQAAALEAAAADTRGAAAPASARPGAASPESTHSASVTVHPFGAGDAPAGGAAAGGDAESKHAQPPVPRARLSQRGGAGEAAWEAAHGGSGGESPSGARGGSELTPSSSKRFAKKELLMRRTDTIRSLDAEMADGFTHTNLRKLFRIFDVDNNKQIKHDEFANGLVALGYGSASDPVVVARFLKEIDADNTGFVTEDEFIAYFKRLKTDDIRSKMSRYAASSTLRCTVVEYGAFASQHGEVELDSDARLCDFLIGLEGPAEFVRGANKGLRRWFDIRGYSTPAMEMIAGTFGLHPETVKDAVIFQQSKVETLHAAHCEVTDKDRDMRAQLLLHMLTLHNVPLRAAAKGGPPELVAAEALASSPPEFEYDQMSLIVIDDHTLVTIRSADTEDDADSCDAVFRSVRARLASYSGGLSSLHSSSAKALAFEIADNVLQHNYEIRDTIKDWQNALERSIRERARSFHIPHLYGLGKLAASFSRSLEPLKKDLDVHQWRKSQNGIFFSGQDILFRELYDDLDTITSDVDAVVETVKQLHELYQRLAADQMNRVLYILTIVTTGFIPAQFLTGLWGMNFSEMPELQLEYGYVLFWALALTSCAFTGCAFFKWNLFNL